MRFARRLFWIASAVCVVAACAGGGKVAVSAQSDRPAESAGVEDAGAPDGDTRDGAAAESTDAATDAAEAAPAPPPIDPLLVEAAIDKTSEPDPDSALGLRFAIAELGPRNYWGMAVVNRGTRPVRVVFDARALSLELEPPIDPKKKWLKPKRTVCRLPDNLVPSEADPLFTVDLAPGEGLVEAFDPRFYCVPSKQGQALRPGLKVTARLGWTPKPPKVVWRKGKRVEEPVPQVEPFVAEAIEARPEEDRDAGAEEATNPTAAGETAPTDLRVKQLVASTFELNAEYAPPEADRDPPAPLELRMVRGSDAANERTVTVTIGLRNRSKKSVKVFFRRELVSYEIMGPAGLTTCEPEPADRAPARTAFSTIRPGGELTATSRLVELCPEETFARPGLYLVHGRFKANRGGDEFGIAAFTGVLYSDEPAVVRVRDGELPLTPSRARMRFSVGERAAVPAQTDH